VDIDLDVESFDMVGQHQGLVNPVKPVRPVTASHAL
jgi:hypothetical protein